MRPMNRTQSKLPNTDKSIKMPSSRPKPTDDPLVIRDT